MAVSAAFTFRRGVHADALCLGMLATQVFLDTYATAGLDADLANEASAIHSPAALADCLVDPRVEITVAEANGLMVGFIDLALDGVCPIPAVVGPELRRVYVQAPFHRRGLGTALMRQAEMAALAKGASHLWLTAWSENTVALSFYPAMGYEDRGATQYVIAGKSYKNRVFAKSLSLNEKTEVKPT